MKCKIGLVLVLISIALIVTFSGCVEEEPVMPTPAPTPTPKPTPTLTPALTTTPIPTPTQPQGISQPEQIKLSGSGQELKGCISSMF